MFKSVVLTLFTLWLKVVPLDHTHEGWGRDGWGRGEAETSMLPTE